MTVLDKSTIVSRYRSVAKRSSTYTWFNYQPINLPGYEDTLPLAGRCCLDRSEALRQLLSSSFGGRKLRIIDWGCNLGFFCFELAKQGHEVVGVDTNAELIEICRYLAETNEFDVKPRFFCDELSCATLPNYDDFDVAICLSVLHHMGKKRNPTLDMFSATYPAAFIEMDGPGLGRDVLFSFYWNIDEVVQTDDRYGRGTRRRKTWFCRNRDDSAHYANIKCRNLLPNRGVFRVNNDSKVTVIKRERLDSRHSWINTNLEHEITVYQQYGESRFFPKLISFSQTDRFRWMEVEHIATDASVRRAELEELFGFLEHNRLFILDLQTDSFLFRDGRLKVVDLETIFHVDTTIDALLRERTRRESIRLDTHEKQLAYLCEKLLE